MKKIILYILCAVLISVSCSGISRTKAGNNIKPEIILQTSAAFKSAEFIYENEWKLIFRKIDDCQYIVLHTDINKINKYPFELVVPSDNSSVTNTDFVNLRFNINYTEESIPDPVTGENIIINRLKSIERTPGDRFASAGLKDDTLADEFVLKLKKYVREDSASEISLMVSYPLETINNKRKVKINDTGSFIKNYSRIFNRKVKSAILNQPLADITAGADGLRLGTGEVWIKPLGNGIFITSVSY